MEIHPNVQRLGSPGQLAEEPGGLRMVQLPIKYRDSHVAWVLLQRSILYLNERGKFA